MTPKKGTGNDYTNNTVGMTRDVGPFLEDECIDVN